MKLRKLPAELKDNGRVRLRDEVNQFERPDRRRSGEPKPTKMPTDNNKGALSAPPTEAELCILQNQLALLKFLARLAPNELAEAIRATERLISAAIIKDAVRGQE